MKKLLSLSVLIAILWGCCNVEDTPKTDEKPANYIVTFDANGGKGIMPEQVFISGAIQELNTNAFENGDYVFTYWNTEADGTGATYVSGNYYSLTSDITLYAQWEIDNPENKDSVKTYTVTFDANGGSGIMPEQVFISGTTQVLNTSSFENGDYVFTYWNTEADGTGATYVSGNYYSLTSDITLYAQWKLNENEEESPDNPVEMYTITFDSNNGTNKKYTQTFISETSQSLNTNCFFYSGYTFTGWNTKADGNGTVYTDSQSISVTSDLVLYAQWKYVGGEESPDNPVEMYTITFDSNNGTNKKYTQTFMSEISQSLNTNCFFYRGYTFTGWNTKAEGNGTAYTDSQSISITSDLVLYAQWKYVGGEESPDNPVEMYTITFDSNNGTNKKYTQTFISETSQSLNTNCFFYSGYTFTGWNTKAEGNGTAYTDSQSISITSDLVLYAQWNANTYNVKFDSNGGNGEMTNQTLTYGISEKLTNNTFENVGYIFAGWATKKDGSVIYTNGQEVENLTDESNATVILYAVWTMNKSGITITLPPTNDVEIKLKQFIEGNIVSFVADDDFDSYAWYIDGVKQNETSEVFTIDTLSMNSMVYKIMVIVSIDDEYYSATADLDVRRN